MKLLNQNFRKNNNNVINIMFHTSCLSIFKNETMNLKLWIEHYLWQGIEHFYLIDNGSDDNPLSILHILFFLL